MPARVSLFFFNDPATTEIYTLSLHDALPISAVPIRNRGRARSDNESMGRHRCQSRSLDRIGPRPEEHTSELQSHLNLVCRLLLEKKTKKSPSPSFHTLPLHIPSLIRSSYHHI